jgi:aminomethyltransferase
MKRTPFYSLHRALGAKLVEFGGFEMPVQYRGIIEEHRAVRQAVGLFDVSHMGEFRVAGRGALDFLQRVTINDVSKLAEGRAQYSALCYEDGGIVDDLLVYHRGDDFMLVVNASNLKKDFDWLLSNISGDVTLDDASDRTALLAVQGPKSLETLQKLTDTDLSSIEYYHHRRCMVGSVSVLISRTGYTGELGFELYFDANASTAENVWNSIMKAGSEFGIAPVGLGARDTLRLEMGFCLYGNDIDESTNPLEAGLGWITKLNKPDFIGKQSLLAVKEHGLKRKLVGFTLPDKALARHGYPILVDGKEIGHVTSGTFSPTLERGIGMGYVATQFAEPGTSIVIDVRGRQVGAKVVSLPFVKKQ